MSPFEWSGEKKNKKNLANNPFIPECFYMSQTFKGRATEARTRTQASTQRVPGFSIHINNTQLAAGAPQSFQELRVVSADTPVSRGDTAQRRQARGHQGSPFFSTAPQPRSPSSEVATAAAAARVLSCSPLNEAARAHTPPRTAARGTGEHARLEPACLGPAAVGGERPALRSSARRRPAHISVRLGLGLRSRPGGR